MKEEVSGMGRPNSRAELCAWVLGLMGAFFLLFGGAVLLWDIPVGGAGPDWAFLPIGAALLAAGGGCALALSLIHIWVANRVLAPSRFRSAQYSSTARAMAMPS